MPAANGTFDVSTRDGLIAFYDESFDAVYRSAARLTRGNQSTAEDLVQEAYLRLTRAARDGKVVFVGVGWMVTTVRRIFIDRLRSAGREENRVRLVAAADRPTSEWSHPADGSDAADLLSDLTDRERTALVLRYVEDLTVSDVADLLDTTVRATESLLQRAKTKARAGRSQL